MTLARVQEKNKEFKLTPEKHKATTAQNDLTHTEKRELLMKNQSGVENINLLLLLRTLIALTQNNKMFSVEKKDEIFRAEETIKATPHKLKASLNLLRLHFRLEMLCKQR